jgi:maleylacetate reductase
MLEFNYKALPWNIIFGAGTLQTLPQEIEKLGFERAMVLTTPQQQSAGEDILQLIGTKGAGLFSEAKMHVPAQTLESAKSLADEIKADCTISLGGGSTTGLGKALAAQKALPNIAIPTSFAGSEMTNIWAVTETDRKVTARDEVVVPTLTIYDPELTLTMPVGFAMVSGLNALAQAVPVWQGLHWEQGLQDCTINCVMCLAAPLIHHTQKPMPYCCLTVWLITPQLRNKARNESQKSWAWMMRR